MRTKVAHLFRRIFSDSRIGSTLASRNLRLADQSLDAGDYVSALNAYQNVLKAAPNRAEAHYGWGLAALELGRADEAMEAFRRAFGANPPHREAGLRLAKMTLAKKDDVTALEIYQRVLDVTPNLAEAHYGWGVAALELGRADEAMEAFRHALAANPSDREAGLRLAKMTLAKNENVAALDIYQRVLDVAPDLAEARYGWGVAAFELGRTDEAMEAFRRAWQADRPPILAGLRWAKMTLAKGDDTAALNIFQKILDVAPEAAEARYGWGVAALKLGRTDEAIEAFHRALGTNPPDPEAGLRLAEMALAKGEDNAALDFYQRVLDIAPNLAEAHYGWGVAAFELGRADEALQAFRRAFGASPPHREAGLRLAEMMLANRENVAALDIYQRVLNLAPDLAEAHYGWGLAALELGRADEAMAAFRRALEASPPNPEAGLRLAEMTLAKGESEAALAIFQRVLDIAPKLAEAHYGWGVAALELGRAEEALVAYQQALALKPDYPSAIAAEAFLSLFPQPRPARRARRQRALICLPILPFQRGWLGGQIYLLNFARIVSCLPKSRRPHVVIAILMKDWQEDPTLRQVIERLFDCEAVIGIFDRERRLISSKPVLDRYARHKGRSGLESADWTQDLFAQVDWTFPILYPLWGAATVPGPLFWIPDLQHRFWPSFFSPVELASRNSDMAALSERPVPVIFSSFDAQAHFREFYPKQRSRTHVWHFCTLSDPAPTASESEDYTALKLPTRFYYIANQFWPHKDHTTLFLALRRILDAGHDFTFACTGTDLATNTNPYARRLLALIDELALGRNLRLLGVLPRSIQIEIMRRACAIIQPSLFEGWSTVVEDARALGRPLIVSNIAVHREQTGEDAVFFTPQDPASLAAAVIAIDSKLAPGPDLNREAAARENLVHRALLSADRFLDIFAAEPTLQP